MKQEKIPKFVLESMGTATSREFKRIKRLQLKAVRATLHDFLTGHAYCPGRFDCVNALNQLEDHQNDLAVKNWGR